MRCLLVRITCPLVRLTQDEELTLPALCNLEPSFHHSCNKKGLLI